jgi:hypothetical protein
VLVLRLMLMTRMVVRLVGIFWSHFGAWFHWTCCLGESFFGLEEEHEEEERVSRRPVVVVAVAVVACICCCTGGGWGQIVAELLVRGDRARRIWALVAAAIHRTTSLRHSLDSIVRGEVCEVEAADREATDDAADPATWVDSSHHSSPVSLCSLARLDPIMDG